MSILLPCDPDDEDSQGNPGGTNDTQAAAPEDIKSVSGGTRMRRMPADETSIRPVRCRVPEAARRLGVSPRHLRYRIANGDISTVRDGSGVFVLDSEVVKYGRKDRPNSARKVKTKRLQTAKGPDQDNGANQDTEEGPC